MEEPTTVLEQEGTSNIAEQNDLHLQSLFEDHPILYDYMMLNEKEAISTTEELLAFHASGRYRPAESSEDVFLMTALMVILNTRMEQGPPGQPPRRIKVA